MLNCVLFLISARMGYDVQINSVSLTEGNSCCSQLVTRNLQLVQIYQDNFNLLRMKPWFHILES